MAIFGTILFLILFFGAFGLMLQWNDKRRFNNSLKAMDAYNQTLRENLKRK